MSLFSFFKQKPTENQILNKGLKLAMEFGVNWLKPINERLLKKYKFLTSDEAKHYNSVCQKAMSTGHQYIYKRLDKLVASNSKIKNAELKDEFNTHLKSKFSWISNGNLNKLYSQGYYYAYKDGLHTVISN